MDGAAAPALAFFEFATRGPFANRATARMTAMARGSAVAEANSTGSAPMASANSTMNDSLAKLFCGDPSPRNDDVRSGADCSRCATTRTRYYRYAAHCGRRRATAERGRGPGELCATKLPRQYSGAGATRVRRRKDRVIPTDDPSPVVEASDNVHHHRDALRFTRSSARDH